MVNRPGKKRKGASDPAAKSTAAASPPAGSQQPPPVAASSGPKPSWHIYLAKEPESFRKHWKTDTQSPEEVLAAQMAKWKSRAYLHFHPPQIIYEGGRVKYKFVCLKYGKESVVRTRTDDGTGNLLRHINSCDATVPEGQTTLTGFAQGSTYSYPRFRFLLACWTARRHRPFLIVQDAELVEIFKMLHTGIDIPHPTTVSRDVREMFTLTRDVLGQSLQEYPGHLHLCINGWTSPNVISFLGITVHFVLNGRMDSVILDFVVLKCEHTGEYLAQQLQKTLEEFGIEKKIFAVTADNASNNDTLVSELESNLGGINSVRTRVRCFAHVLNLVVKAVLTGFKRKRGEAVVTRGDEEDVLTDPPPAGSVESTGTESGDDFELDSAALASDEQTIEDIIAELMDERNLSAADREFGQKTVSKVTGLAKRVFHSPVLRQHLANCCGDAAIESRQMVRAVDTRWNSFVEAVARAIYLKDVLKKLFAMSKYNKEGPEGLLNFKLLDDEWLLLGQLHTLLKPFLLATKRVSKSSQPLIHEVIPIIDVLTEALEDAVADTALKPSVRVGAARGLAVMNKYYGLTDGSIMFRCAMLLHPRYKKKYFARAEWLESWVDDAVNDLRDLWKTHYKPTPSSDTAEAGDASTEDLEADDFFASIDNFGRESGTESDPLEEYLSAPTHACDDPLLHWTSLLDQGRNMLARMALDVLSTPASSTDVERAFSRGGLVVSKRRHALSDESTHAAAVFGLWVAKGGIVPDKKILKNLANKAKRKRGEANLTDNSESELDPQSGSESDSVVVTTPVIVVE